jgi:hypothetical protein
MVPALPLRRLPLLVMAAASLRLVVVATTPPTSPTLSAFPPGGIDAAFEGGNFDPNITRWTSDNTLQYAGRIVCGIASTKCSPYTNWAYFHVSNVSTAHPTTLITLAKMWLSPPWFSYSNGATGRDWVRLNTSTGGVTTYTFAQPSVYIAFSIPYVPSKQQAQLLDDLGPHPFVHPFSVVTSEAGNEVTAVNISTAGSGAPRALVWFQARQHAWESGGSWVADGVARYAASADGVGLRAVADVVVLPIMDVDNVVVGGAGKDQEPVDFNRDWCALGNVARNETGALCQHWAAIRAVVARIGTAMQSGRYDTLIFVDSHSPGNPADPAQVWTECRLGPTAVSPHAWNLTQGYKSLLKKLGGECGRLQYKDWCAEVGPAYGNGNSGFYAMQISFMDLFYRQYPVLMNSPAGRSMSFSHETSAATVDEAHCYGAAIGGAMEQVVAAAHPPDPSGASSVCTGYPDSCHARPPGPAPPPPTPPCPDAYTVSGAGSSDCNGVYRRVPAPSGWEASPYYRKDDTHTLYRYKGTAPGSDFWHLCNPGKYCYYDGPVSSNGAPLPPASGWCSGACLPGLPNATGVSPPPQITPSSVTTLL